MVGGQDFGVAGGVDASTLGGAPAAVRADAGVIEAYLGEE